jgi:hypothetical protein
MQESKGFARSSRGGRRRALSLMGGLVVFLAAAAPASATVRVQNFNDPAGDQTVMAYSITRAATPQAPPITFTLPAGEGAHANERSFGPGAGVYVIQAAPAAGWRVADIQCFSNVSPNVFSIDVPNGRVTLNHGGTGAEDTCAFTNRRIGATAPGQASGPGVAPSPPAADQVGIVLPRKAAVLRVAGGRRFATATSRVTRSSVSKGQLLWRGNRVVGSVRVVRAAGTHVVRVTVRESMRKVLARLGQQQVRLTLRLVVSPARGKTAQVFRFGVRVRVR